MQPKTIYSLIALAASPLCHAADEAGIGVPSTTFFQALIGLLLIVALLGATAWLARKMSGGRGFGQGGMRVIGGVSLGPRERVMLVEVGDSWLVIGVVPGQIRTLHTLPKGEDPSATNISTEKPFAHWLKHMMEKRGNAS